MNEMYTKLQHSILYIYTYEIDKNHRSAPNLK